MYTYVANQYDKVCHQYTVHQLSDRCQHHTPILIVLDLKTFHPSSRTPVLIMLANHAVRLIHMAPLYQPIITVTWAQGQPIIFANLMSRSYRIRLV